MNVASKELCEELYELLRWVPLEYEPMESQGRPYPLYDLGFLIRKLPGYPELRKRQHDWQCYLDGAGMGHAATPEDAAAKLAIDLFRLGILKREEKQ